MELGRQAPYKLAILFYENRDYSGYPFIDGATCLDSIEKGIMQDWTITHFSEQAGLVPSSYPWLALSEEPFTSAWRSGEFAVVNWARHGWCDGAYRTVWNWDDGDGVPEFDANELWLGTLLRVHDPLQLQSIW